MKAEQIVRKNLRQCYCTVRWTRDSVNGVNVNTYKPIHVHWWYAERFFQVSHFVSIKAITNEIQNDPQMTVQVITACTFKSRVLTDGWEILAEQNQAHLIE